MRDKQANNCAKQIAEHGNIEYVVKGVMFYYYSSVSPNFITFCFNPIK